MIVVAGKPKPRHARPDAADADSGEGGDRILTKPIPIMQRAELNLIQRIWLEVLWLGARLFAILPYWLKYYVIEDLIYFLLCYCHPLPPEGGVDESV